MRQRRNREANGNGERIDKGELRARGMKRMEEKKREGGQGT